MHMITFIDPYTVVIDLQNGFSTRSFDPVSQTKKIAGIPVLNHFSISKDSAEDAIYVRDGHFHEDEVRRQSSYFVSRKDIPSYSIWKFNALSHAWHNVTGQGNSKDRFQRATGGSMASVPSLNLSFYIGFALALPSRGSGGTLR
jgi:hypothetical protein